MSDTRSMPATEAWLLISCSKGKYEVSDFGRVRRVDTGRVQKPFPNPQGYLHVSLSLGSRKHRVCKVLHALVANAFLGPRPNGLTINHKDGNKLNNQASNLEYVTHLENQNHARLLGLKAFGARNGNVKVTWPIVDDIRSLHTAGSSKLALARQFGLSDRQVARIIDRSNWNEAFRPPHNAEAAVN